MFNCAIDAKLRACDLGRLTVSDVVPGGVLRTRSTVIQQKTGGQAQAQAQAEAQDHLASRSKARHVSAMVAPPRLPQTELHADPHWRVARLSLDYMLDSIELSRAGGDVVDRLLLAAILDANVAPVKQDPGLQFAYGAVDDAPPEAVLRPVTISGVAHSLRLPFETARRRVNRLAREGALVMTPRGVLVSHTHLDSPAFKALGLARYHRLRRFHHDLVQAQLLPHMHIAAAPHSRPPPVRVANRVLAEFLMRCIESVMTRVGHPVDGLLLLHMLRANLPPIGEEAAPLTPVASATLANLSALPRETVRRRLQALERAGFCRRSRAGALLAPEIMAHSAAATLLQETASHVERLFTRLARLGVLADWGAEPQTGSLAQSGKGADQE